MVKNEIKISVEGVSTSQDPIKVLNQMIETRSKLLHQSIVKSTASVAVNALKSVRTATRDARKRKSFKIKVEETPYFVGFSYSEKRPCLRSGNNRYSPKVSLDSKVVYLTKGIKNPQKDAHVYKVTYEKKNLKPVFIACSSKKVALDFAIKATQHRIDNRGTLAKNALSVAVGKIASKTLKLDGSSESKTMASKLVDVQEWNSGLDYTVKITDNVEYSEEALKGGQNALNIALQKAANKTYGTLSHLCGIDFTDKFPEKPFPDVGNKKRV